MHYAVPLHILRVPALRENHDVIAYFSSDERLKENVTPISNAIAKVKQIRGVEFDWIKNDEVHHNEGHDIGVIAQEIEKVLPEIITTKKSGYKGVKYDKIVALLIQAVKEQQKEIEELKEKSHEPQNYREECEQMKKEVSKLKIKVNKLSRRR